MKKILVPVDFSEDTSLLSRYALELARHDTSMICLMHSYYDRMTLTESSFPSSVETETFINEQLLKESYEQAEERMGHLKGALLKLAGQENIPDIIITTHLEGGEPGFGIIEYCSVYNPDIIVMGTSGRGKKGFLEGSVSRKIMNNASIPVLAIPSMSQFRAFSKMLYLTNFDKNDARSINTMLELMRPFNFNTYVLHLLDETKHTDTTAKLDHLRSYFLEEEDKGLIKFILQKKTNYRKDMLEFTHEHSIDMISFIPHKRTFLDGFFRKVMTKKDLYEANIPLLSIPGQT